MASGRQVKLRVGVIGLGRLWEARHKPAMARMMDRLRVVAVYDQVVRRAEIEANVLGCAAAPGIAALIERPDVEAIYLLSPQWFGLHALQLAASSGKPIYCGLPLASEPGSVAAIEAAMATNAAVFMPEFARRAYPATLRLRELLATSLGRPRLVVGQVRLSGFDRYDPPGPSTQLSPLPLLIDPGGYLIDWCRAIFGAEPVSIAGLAPSTRVDDHEVESIAIEFPEGAHAHLTIARYQQARGSEAAKSFPPPGIQVYAERGAAWLELPDRIVWSVEGGTREERLSVEPSIGETLNAQFHRAVTTGQPASPGWNDALAVARLVRRLSESRGAAPA